MKKLHYCVCMLITSMNAPSIALQTYPCIDQQKTELTISSKDQNRITVQSDRIQQIFGADSTFDVQSDDESGQIFIKTLSARQTKPITITLVTEAGLTHDLRLTPQDIHSQSILLKPQIAPEIHETKQLTHSHRLVSLIKAMATGNQLEGYSLSALKRSERNYPEPLKITPQVVYCGELEEGHVYLLKNEGEAPLELTEKILALPADLLLSLSKTFLNPEEIALLFVVSKLRRAA